MPETSVFRDLVFYVLLESTADALFTFQSTFLETSRIHGDGGGMVNCFYCFVLLYLLGKESCEPHLNVHGQLLDMLCCLLFTLQCNVLNVFKTPSKL